MGPRHDDIRNVLNHSDGSGLADEKGDVALRRAVRPQLLSSKQKDGHLDSEWWL